MRSLFFSLYFLFLFVTSCNNGQPIVDRFYAITAANSLLTTQDLTLEIDNRSLTYLQRLAETCSQPSNLDAEALGYKYQLLLTTLFTYEIMKTDSVSAQQLTAEQILLSLAMNGLGIFRQVDSQGLTLKGSPRIVNNDAYAEVLVPIDGNGSSILSTYHFSLEENIWKLDLLSTLTMNERLFQQLRQRDGQSPTDFAKAYANKVPEDIRIQYMSPR